VQRVLQEKAYVLLYVRNTPLDAPSPARVPTQTDGGAAAADDVGGADVGVPLGAGGASDGEAGGGAVAREAAGTAAAARGGAEKAGGGAGGGARVPAGSGSAAVPRPRKDRQTLSAGGSRHPMFVGGAGILPGLSLLPRSWRGGREAQVRLAPTPIYI